MCVLVLLLFIIVLHLFTVSLFLFAWTLIYVLNLYSVENIMKRTNIKEKTKVTKDE